MMGDENICRVTHQNADCLRPEKFRFALVGGETADISPGALGVDDLKIKPFQTGVFNHSQTGGILKIHR